MSETENIQDETDKLASRSLSGGNRTERTPSEQLAVDNKQEPTQQLQPATENMETHAAHLHKAPGQGWKHYLFEFLMLFLAVFCGFLAEYQLEHKIEKDRERQYVQSFVEDLSTDTASLRKTINNFNNRIKNLDTLLSLFSRLPDGYDHKLHEKLYATTGFADSVKADRTMQQLKNSGGMRLIRKQKAADAITNYDLMNRDLDIDVSSLQDIFYRVMATRFEIIDSEALVNDMKIKTTEEMEAGKKNYLLTSGKPSLGKFNNEIREFRVMCQMVRNSEEKVRKKAIELMALLKEEYHLE